MAIRHHQAPIRSVARPIDFEIYVANGRGLIPRRPRVFEEFTRETRLTEVISALVERSTNILNFTIVSVPEEFTQANIETIMSNPPMFHKVKLSKNEAEQEKIDSHVGYISDGLQILSTIVLNYPIPESSKIKDVLKYKYERYSETATFQEPAARKLVAIPTMYVFKVYDAIDIPSPFEEDQVKEVEVEEPQYGLRRDDHGAKKEKAIKTVVDFIEKDDMYVQIGLGTTVEDVFFQIFPDEKGKQRPDNSLNRIYLIKEQPDVEEARAPRSIGGREFNAPIFLTPEFLNECLFVDYIVGIKTSKGLSDQAVDRFRALNGNKDEPETDIISKLRSQGAVPVLPVFRDTLSASKQLRLLLPFWPIYADFLIAQDRKTKSVSPRVINRADFVHFALMIWHYWDLEYISNAVDPEGNSPSKPKGRGGPAKEKKDGPFEKTQKDWIKKRNEEDGGRIKQIFNFYEDPDFPPTQELFKKFLKEGVRENKFVEADPLFGERDSLAQTVFRSKVDNIFKNWNDNQEGGGRGGKTRRKKLKLRKSRKRNRTNRRHR
jgi:hypothetical protein